jgi:hypothetical protein
VVIGIDPHIVAWTAAAVDTSRWAIATVRVPVRRAGYCDLRRFALLHDGGIVAVDVPTKLAPQVRMRSPGHSRKNRLRFPQSNGLQRRSVNTHFPSTFASLSLY